MNSISTIIFLLSGFLASGYSKPADPDPSADLKAALAFIECSQKAIITGIPEAGIPNHDPLKFAHNSTFTLPLGLTEITVHLDNIQMDGIPWWNVTEAVQAVSDDPNVVIFNFTIYWPLMSLSADLWSENASLLMEDEDIYDKDEDGATLYIELDHLNFHIGWQSTKPQPEKNGTLDEFSLSIDVKESQVNVTHLGYYGDLINAVGGDLVTFLVNNNPEASELSENIKEILVKNYIEKPERIDAINDNCKK